MDKPSKKIGDSDAREITTYLLGKGISQKKIAELVDKSQPWVAGVKKEQDIANSAKEAGRQEVKDEIVANVASKTAQEIANKVFPQSNIPTIEAAK